MDSKLETLISFSETKNYTKTAQILGLTQPAVSQHIHALEKQYGCQFVRRLEGGMQLTPQGELAVQYARQIVGLYKALEQRMEDFRRCEGGIAVGLTHSAESHVMAQVLARCCEGRDDIGFTIHTGSVGNLREKLRDGVIDLAVVEGEDIEDPALTSILLDTDNLMLAVYPDHALAGADSVPLEALKQENLILRLPDSGTRNQFQAELEGQNMSLADFRVTLQVDSISTIKELIMSRFGVSVLARSACLKEMQSGQLVLLPVQGLRMSREIRLVYRKQFRRTEVLNDLIQTYDRILSEKRKESH